MNIRQTIPFAACLLILQGMPSAASVDMQLQLQMQAQVMNAAANNAALIPRDMYAYMTLFAKDTMVKGFGTLHRLEGGFFLGSKERCFIEMEGHQYIPDVTDSVYLYDNKGVPGDQCWLFLQSRGRITTYSGFPYEQAMKASLDGGRPEPLSAVRSEIEKLLKTIPVAYLFYTWDLDYAIRIFNTASLRQKGGKPVSYVGETKKRLFAADSVSESEMSGYKEFDPSDFMDMTIKAKYLCGKRQFGEAAEWIRKLEAILPDMYSTWQAKGLCADREGKNAEAVRAYGMMLRNAPPYRFRGEAAYTFLKEHDKRMEWLGKRAAK
jgi:hypothetical protein